MARSALREPAGDAGERGLAAALADERLDAAVEDHVADRRHGDRGRCGRVPSAEEVVVASGDAAGEAVASPAPGWPGAGAALAGSEPLAGAAGAVAVAAPRSVAEKTAQAVPASTSASTAAPATTDAVRRRRRWAAVRRLRRLRVSRVGPGMRVVGLLCSGSLQVNRLYAASSSMRANVAEGKPSKRARRIDTLAPRRCAASTREPDALAEGMGMTRTPRTFATRIVLVLLAATCAGALVGCNQPPALTKAELDKGKLSEKHPEVEAKDASNCRKCHREQPPIKQK